MSRALDRGIRAAKSAIKALEQSAPLRTEARVRVLIESTDGKRRWGTVGLSSNVVEASWQALVDSVEYKLHKDNVKPRSKAASAKQNGARPRSAKTADNGHAAHSKA